MLVFDFLIILACFINLLILLKLLKYKIAKFGAKRGYNMQWSYSHCMKITLSILNDCDRLEEYDILDVNTKDKIVEICQTETEISSGYIIDYKNLTLEAFSEAGELPSDRKVEGQFKKVFMALSKLKD